MGFQLFNTSQQRLDQNHRKTRESRQRTAEQAGRSSGPVDRAAQPICWTSRSNGPLDRAALPIERSIRMGQLNPTFRPISCNSIPFNAKSNTYAISLKSGHSQAPSRQSNRIRTVSILDPFYRILGVTYVP